MKHGSNTDKKYPGVLFLLSVFDPYFIRGCEICELLRTQAWIGLSAAGSSVWLSFSSA
jgi:hypothetical protein